MLIYKWFYTIKIPLKRTRCYRIESLYSWSLFLPCLVLFFMPTVYSVPVEHPLIENVIIANTSRSTNPSPPLPHAPRSRPTPYTRVNPGAGAVELQLLRQILQRYDTDARGVTNNRTVHVEIQLLVLRIQSLDERSQVLTTTGLIICDWTDDRLRWKKEEFDNLEDIVIKPERIWLPELALMNGAEELAPDFRQVRVLIRHDGAVHWEPGSIFMTTCDIDIRYFPFDDQSCPIQLGAWAYDSSRMNITNGSAEVQTQDMMLNGEWIIYMSRAEWKENILPCCPHIRYPYVEFTLYLRRRYTFYVINIILPCTLLSVLVLVVFCLPPDAGEKVALGISVLLAFTVFLLMVAENIPKTSLHIPVIVVFLTCTMGLGTTSVCLTVLVLNLHHRDPECPVPHWLKVTVLQHLARWLSVQPRRPKTMANNILMNSDNKTAVKGGVKRIAKGLGQLKPTEVDGYVKRISEYSIDTDGYTYRTRRNRKNRLEKRNRGLNDDWKEVAHVLDRLFFWILLLSMTASVLMIILVPVYKQDLKN